MTSTTSGVLTTVVAAQWWWDSHVHVLNSNRHLFTSRDTNITFNHLVSTSPWNEYKIFQYVFLLISPPVPVIQGCTSSLQRAGRENLIQHDRNTRDDDGYPTGSLLCPSKVPPELSGYSGHRRLRPGRNVMSQVSTVSAFCTSSSSAQGWTLYLCPSFGGEWIWEKMEQLQWKWKLNAQRFNRSDNSKCTSRRCTICFIPFVVPVRDLCNFEITPFKLFYSIRRGQGRKCENCTHLEQKHLPSRFLSWKDDWYGILEVHKFLAVDMLKLDFHCTTKSLALIDHWHWLIMNIYWALNHKVMVL